MRDGQVGQVLVMKVRVHGVRNDVERVAIWRWAQQLAAEEEVSEADRAARRAPIGRRQRAIGARFGAITTLQILHGAVVHGTIAVSAEGVSRVGARQQQVEGVGPAGAVCQRVRPL